jgi:hypothetical protein
MPQTEDAQFYQHYFQTPGVADAELERDVRRTIRSLLYSASGDVPRPENAANAGGDVGMVSRKGGLLDSLVDPVVLPPWLTDADIDFYA